MNGEEPMDHLDGDPDAMLRFAQRLDAGPAPEPAAFGPAPVPCEGGARGCARFTAADLAATAALDRFLVETQDAVTALRSAAYHSARDYLAGDEAGALTLLAAVLGVEGPRR